MNAFDNLFAVTSISASGLTAERVRMEVVANNIANAYSTRTPGGGPYRRQDVVFSAVLNERLGAGRWQTGGFAGPQSIHYRGTGAASHVGIGMAFGGVQVIGIEDDPTPFTRVHNPGHPDADGEGYVLMPNVVLSMEMVNLITASRAYETNLRALQSFRQMAEQALTLARG